MPTVSKVEFEALSSMPFDWEILGRLYYQARELLQFSNGFGLFSPEENKRDEFISRLLDVSIKVAAMKYHLNNYETYETKCIEAIKKECETQSEVVKQVNVLLFELEAFIFQMKSALDLSVKILEILVPGRFKTKTFGDKGADLLKGLKNYRRDGQVKTQLVDEMISMIEDDQNSWLRDTIRLRDTLAHFRTIPKYNYKCERIDEELRVSVPYIAGVHVLIYMKTTYSNCLGFIQDFMSLSIGLTMAKGFTVGVSSGRPKTVGEPLDQYIKFGVGIADDSGC